MIRSNADWLAQTGPQSAVTSADLGVVVQGHMMYSTSPHYTDLCGALKTTFATARRLAIQVGLKVVAIPDFAFGLVKTRPDHILSFHTAGRFPGFTHFKRGDLPGYMVVDAGGYSGWSSLSGAALADLQMPDLTVAKMICDRLWQDIVATNVSKYEQADAYDAGDPLPQT
jgi:hypothetical protein